MSPLCAVSAIIGGVIAGVLLLCLFAVMFGSKLGGDDNER